MERVKAPSFVLCFVSLVCILTGITLQVTLNKCQELQGELKRAKEAVDLAKHVTELHRKECPAWGKEGELCVATALWFQYAEGRRETLRVMPAAEFWAAVKAAK